MSKYKQGDKLVGTFEMLVSNNVADTWELDEYLVYVRREGSEVVVEMYLQEQELDMLFDENYEDRVRMQEIAELETRLAELKGEDQ